MNGLTRFLDWLDEAAAALIRIAYLAAGVTAVAVYFGAGHLPRMVEDPLNAALPWALAFAVETHTYITARRVRAAWQEKSWGALKVNLGILAFLLAFSAWNQLGYLSETWQPPAVALALPGWLAVTVRALVVPAAFMAAAFLAPLAEPVTMQIEAEARSTLADVFKIARKQRRRMLRDAQRSGRDMTGALVELVQDPDTRRIISHAYGAIGAPVAPPSATLPPVIVETPPAPSSVSTVAPDEPPTRGPTGPGSPSRKPGVRKRRKRAGKLVALRNPSVEERAAAAWQPGMSIPALEKAAGISRASAQKYAAKFAAAQQSQQPDQGQQAAQ